MNHSSSLASKILRKDSHTINKGLAEFIQITDKDARLLAQHREALLEATDGFMQVFSDYLFSSPTPEFLEDYRNKGNKITELFTEQFHHLTSLLSGDTLARSTSHKGHSIAYAYFKHGIEPIWIMGIYRLYLSYIQTHIAGTHGIQQKDRAPLEHAITKLVLHDISLLMDGYWDASMQELHLEKVKVSDLHDQVGGLLKNIDQIFWSISIADNRLIYVSPAMQKFCKGDVEMPIPCLQQTMPADQEVLIRAWHRALKGEKAEIETRIRVPDKGQRWIKMVFQPFHNTSGKVIRVDGMMEDISDMKETHESIRRLTSTDILTGLPNRMLWHDRLRQAISTARICSDNTLSVAAMILDLNNFKAINDTLGHAIGDEILHIVAQRLRGAVSDSAILARLGGDEFGILIPHFPNDTARADKIIESIFECFAEPVWYGNNELYLSASIGIALFPQHGNDADTLISRADVAMYEAKQDRAGYLFYNAKFDKNSTQRLQMSSDLRHALERGEFELHYQPRVNLKTGRIRGVEALLRWQHPRFGMMLPDQFLAVAEESGLINRITDWVLTTAVAQIGTWHHLGLSMPVAVNVSARTFQSPKWVGKLQQLFQNSTIPAALLEIEITEDVLMADFKYAYELATRLSELGISIAIDDFGTGYSSLSYLKKLPINTLKIDKSFVVDMVENESDAVIVRSTIELGHNLGFKVVAEGVETKAIWDSLITLGCDDAQGYYLSKPLSAELTTAWLATSPWGMLGIGDGSALRD